MDEQFYYDYLKQDAAGDKKAAKKAIGQFVSSFRSYSEKKEWTNSFLNRRKTHNKKIRHELFEFVVFPVLEKGFQEDDPKCRFWLGCMIQNLFSARRLHEKISFLGGTELLLRAHAIDPKSEEIRCQLLKKIIEGFDYCDHEWPAGLLIDETDDRETMLSEVRFARQLDANGNFATRLAEFESRIEQYFNQEYFVR